LYFVIIAAEVGQKTKSYGEQKLVYLIIQSIVKKRLEKS
jgi:hypothetical protein